MRTFKTILFDLGNVIIDFSAFSFVSEVTQDIDTINLLVNTVFHSQTWLDLDQGIITEAEALDKIHAQLPEEVHAIADKIFAQWHLYLTENKDMTQLVWTLKKKGYQLILCSNAGVRYHEYIGRIEALTHFDDIVFSCDLLISKPDRRIFDVIRDKHQLDYRETFFIDDNASNIRIAMDLGMGVYLYNGNIKLLKRYMEKVEIL